MLEWPRFRVVALCVVLLSGLGGCAVSPAPQGQSPYGQPSSGQSPYGQPSSNQSPYGQPSSNQSPYGQPSSNQSPYGQPTSGQGQSPYGQSPYGQPTSGQSPYGQTQGGQVPYGQAPAGQTPEPPPPTIGHRMLFWLPNRLFDILDLARARVRVGPGMTFSMRFTEVADVNMGKHSTFYLGLRGPRGRAVIPWPGGLESYEGFEFSIKDESDEDSEGGPRYGPLEVGLGFQFLLVGVDIGLAAWEAVDFLAGVILFDPQGDDF